MNQRTIQADFMNVKKKPKTSSGPICMHAWQKKQEKKDLMILLKQWKALRR